MRRRCAPLCKRPRILNLKRDAKLDKLELCCITSQCWLVDWNRLESRMLYDDIPGVINHGVAHDPIRQNFQESVRTRASGSPTRL